MSSTHRIAATVLAALAAGHACADDPKALLQAMAGVWDVEQRMWPAPAAAAMALPRAVAERRLVRDAYLEETMRPADASGDAFDRRAWLNYNPVTSTYEYTSLDTRAPQLMVEKGAALPQGRATAADISLAGGRFLAPEWGSLKRVTFSYRLTIGAIRGNQQTVRLYLTPLSQLPKKEFLAFEYVYTKKP